MSAFTLDKLKAVYASATEGEETPDHSNVHEYIARYYREVTSMREWLIAFVAVRVFGIQDTFDCDLLAELHYEVEEQMHGRTERLKFSSVTFATIQTTYHGTAFSIANEVKGVLK